MKKLVKVLAVVMVCALALTALVACAPNTDYESAKKNLKDNKYTVKYAVKEGDVGAATTFTTRVLPKVSGTKLEDIEAYLYAINKDSEEIEIIWFKTEAAAKAFHKAYKVKWDENGGNIDGYRMGITGKCVYEGTTAGIKATK